LLIDCIAVSKLSADDTLIPISCKSILRVVADIALSSLGIVIVLISLIFLNCAI